MNENEIQDPKVVNIALDERSESILKRVNKIHRQSMINLGLAMIEKTDYYKTLCNQPVNNTDVVSLSISNLDNLGVAEKELPTKTTTVKKSTANWDSF